MLIHPAVTHPFAATPFSAFVTPLAVMLSMTVTYGSHNGADCDHSEAQGDDRHKNEFNLTTMTTGGLIGGLAFVVHGKNVAHWGILSNRITSHVSKPELAILR
jgi:hypothetical protein